MKPIIAQDQVKLGPARCATLALTGMSYRLFRSLITVSILALAVAFLVHMLAYGYMGFQTQRTAAAELAEGRRVAEWVTRLTAPTSWRAFLDALLQDDADRLAEQQAWAKAGDADMVKAKAVAAELAAFDRWVRNLAPAARAAAIGDQSSDELLTRLTDAQRLEAFAKLLGDLNVRPPLGEFAQFDKLVTQDRPWLLGLFQRVRMGHAAAIDQVRAATNNTPPRQLFAEPPAGLVDKLAAAGFVIDADALGVLEAQGKLAVDQAAVARAAGNPDVRGAIARKLDIDLPNVSAAALLDWMGSASKAEWFAGVLEQFEPSVKLAAPRLLELAQQHQRQQRLQAAVGDEGPQQEVGALGLPNRTLWLIALSFLVCVVGVANAMLMSVTERFAEIATMKCLGAMDGFVMMMFVFEATLQGLFGGLIGVVLGLVLALLRGLLEFGGLLFASGQAWGAVVASTFVSIAVGVLLAAVAAVGPAWVAARLAPMEAMRVE